LQQLVAIVKQQGGSAVGGMAEELGGEVMVNPSSIINMQQLNALQGSPAAIAVKVESADQYSPLSSAFAGMGHTMVSPSSCDFMEDSSPVSGDPMLTSEPVSPDCDDDSTF
jgi:hypothetical protein